MAEDSGEQFTGWDWAVFAVGLVMSLGTGVVAGWIGRRRAQKGNDGSAVEEFLMGGRTINPIAAALSTMIGATSAVTVLGNPGEMYAHGTQQWMNLFGLSLGFVFIHLIYLAVLYHLKITSVYTYIERRFQSKGLLWFMMYTSLVGGIVYMGLCAYSPSMALETVTGLPTWVSIIILGVTCTIYSTWGGVRAVVYTDVLQVFVMIAGVVVVIVTAVGDVGSLGSVWDIAWDHGRVEWWNFNPDPLQRDSFWLVNVNGFFISLIAFGFTQQQMQRICSVNTFKKAIGALYLTMLILIMVYCLCYFMGVAVFAVYADCDPMATGEIDKPDQIVPFYVIDRLSRFPGLPGLFIAALYAGGLRIRQLSNLLLQLIMTWDWCTIKPREAVNGLGPQLAPHSIHGLVLHFSPGSGDVINSCSHVEGVPKVPDRQPTHVESHVQFLECAAGVIVLERGDKALVARLQQGRCCRTTLSCF